MLKSRMCLVPALGLVLSLFTAACGGAAPVSPTTPAGKPTVAAPPAAVGAVKSSPAAAASAAPGPAAAGMEALIAAAKAEGELVYYTPAPDASSNRVTQAFQAAYGIKTQHTRLAGTALLQRYSSEASGGKIAADALIVAGGAVPFAEDAIKRGWVDADWTQRVPVVQAGTFPTRFLHPSAPLIQSSPWLIAYNKNQLKPEEYPVTWQDLADPKFKGRLLFPDPKAALAYYDLLDLLLRTYGEEYFRKLRANELKLYPGGTPAVQALGAGEGAILFPASMATVLTASNQGAPVAAIQPDLTVGIESRLILTARGMAAHPNAALLFAQWVMSEEGNRIVAGDPGSVSVYDSSGFPKEYKAPTPDSQSPENQQRILSLLGLN